MSETQEIKQILSAINHRLELDTVERKHQQELYERDRKELLRLVEAHTQRFELLEKRVTVLEDSQVEKVTWKQMAKIISIVFGVTVFINVAYDTVATHYAITNKELATLPVPIEITKDKVI